jgi:hypothetical protein
MRTIGVAMTKAVLLVLWVLASADLARASWPTSHGTPGNTGLARVNTAPAANPSGFADVGHVAPGANPVTGSDGMVYIGNVAGELIALFPEGKLSWKRQLNPENGGIFTSPVVDSAGSVYVVSTFSYRDHRGGRNEYVHTSWLHKFSPSGGWLFAQAFPKTHLYPFHDGGASTAPPNIWRSNGTEAIMIPVVYTEGIDSELRVVAFSTEGVVMGNGRVTLQIHDLTAGSDTLDALVDFLIHCHPICSFSPPPGPVPIWPQPGVAIQEAALGSPWVWVADNIRSTVAYHFDPKTGFSEIFRSSDKDDRLSSPPVAVDSLDTVIGTSDGRVKFELQDFSLGAFGEVTAAPSRMADGRLVVITRSAWMAVIKGRVVDQVQALNGPSIASAAASCSHLFISSTNELVTYDVKTMLPVARLPWTDGGRNAPIIGPFGHVYAMTNFGLFIFAPPASPSCNQQVPRTGGGGGVVVP